MKQQTKADLILTATLLITALILQFAVLKASRNASFAVVRVNGETVATFSLDKNGIYELNNGTNILEIKDGYARIIEADCPDKLCQKTGKIHSSGQCITCLPNKLTVTMEGGESQVDFEI